MADPATRVDAWAKIVQESRNKGYKRLLIVQDSPWKGSVADAHHCALSIVEIGLQGLKIAFVDLDLEHYESNQFAQLVATNRGAHLNVFTEETIAVEWLAAK